MQATDLLNPGDFHQVTQQIRELVAYAISQLENAKDDGSLPSGKFAAFLIDAAQKTPGFVDGETGLAPHQALVEDGDELTIDGHSLRVSVKQSAVSLLAFAKDNVRVVQKGDQCWNKVGFRTISATMDFNEAGIYAVSNMPNAAIVVDGEEHPMHDQGGHAGRITSKVTANNVSDMVFTTEGAHIIRQGDNLQCLNREGAAGKFEIAADKSVGFRMTEGQFWVAKTDDAVSMGGITVASTAGKATDGTIGVHLRSDIAIVGVQTMMRVENPAQKGGHVFAMPVRATSGWLQELTFRADCYGLRDEVLFFVNGKDMYQPRITNNLITELSGVV